MIFFLSCGFNHIIFSFSFCMYNYNDTWYCVHVTSDDIRALQRWNLRHWLKCKSIIILFVCSFTLLQCYSHGNWCTATLWNRIMTARCEGMGEVGSARYEPALLPPCPSIRVLSYSNCQRSTTPADGPGSVSVNDNSNSYMWFFIQGLNISVAETSKETYILA